MSRFLKSQSGMVPIFEAVLLVLVLVALGFAGYRVYTEKYTALKPADQKVAKKATPTPASADPYAGWKTFTGQQEHITLRYPASWTVTDTSDGNCGHVILNGSNCRDRFEINSPDGIFLNYVIHTDENDDRIGCGVQSMCVADIVRSVEKFTPPNHSEIELVTTTTESFFQAWLHQPLSSGTEPKIGANAFTDHMIGFTLRSKLGGRFVIGLSTRSQTHEAADQFFNKPSVQDGLKALRSISF